MALDLSAVGATEQQRYPYGWRDVVLYALAVGATREELDYLYEGRGPKVLPTWPLAAAFGVFQRLVERVGGNPRGAVHMAQSIRLHAPLRPAGCLDTRGSVVGVYDLKRFGQSNVRTETRDETGATVCEMEWTTLHRFDGGFGGPPRPLPVRLSWPSREPDLAMRVRVRAEQALLYRLLGDFNPLHADASVAENAGYEAPILHGLCTFGLVTRVLVRELCDSDPTRLRAFSGQFSAPLIPGEELCCEVWRAQDRALVRARTARGEVLSNGLAEYVGSGARTPGEVLS